MNILKRTGLMLLVLIVMLVLRVQADEVAVRIKGEGDSYQEAVNNALVRAIEQHNGVAMSSQSCSEFAVSQLSKTTTFGTDSKSEVNDTVTGELKKIANGRIAGYTILSESIDAATGHTRVEVSVRFTGPYVVGRDPADLRRMVVSPFRATAETYTWYGQSACAADWCAMLADKLNVCLTQTRKFTMLDRKFDADVTAELARLSDANAAPADITRLAQRLGTDYLIVGEVRLNNVQPLIEDSGKSHSVAIASANAIFAEITYRVLLAPTGQLKWADVVKIDAAAFAAHDLVAFVSATTEAAARLISDGLMASILPFEIVGRTASGQLVIGEGGKSLKVGDRFTVFTQGEAVTDTRTGEVIDVIEDVVGTVQIERTTAKLSYAKVVEGDAAKMIKGARLRPMPVDEPLQSDPTIVGCTANGLLVIDEGGTSLKYGELFTVFTQGKKVNDSHTGEVLGVIEDDVGKVQIVRTTENLSYAQVVEGDVAKMVKGARLRLMRPVFKLSQADLKKKKLKKQIMAQCQLPISYQIAVKWFKVSQEIESDELRQLVLKASGAALMASGREDIYFSKVKSLLDDAESFQSSFVRQCPKCGGAGIIEERCKACSGSGRCCYSACRGGNRFVQRLSGSEGSYWTACSDCKGSAVCQKCKASGRRQMKCFRCRGKGVVMSHDAAITTYRNCVKTISMSFKESASEP